MQEEPSKGKRWIGKNVKFERIRRIRRPDILWGHWIGGEMQNLPS